MKGVAMVGEKHLVTPMVEVIGVKVVLTQTCVVEMQQENAEVYCWLQLLIFQPKPNEHRSQQNNLKNQSTYNAW